MKKDKFVNGAHYLLETAENFPSMPAVIVHEGNDHSGKGRYKSYTYKELNERSDVFAYGLEAFGIRRGTRVLFMVKPSFYLHALVFAMVKMGAVPIMLDPAMGAKNVSRGVKESEPEAFIGIPKAHMARMLFGWGKKTIKILITVGKRYIWGGSTLEDVIRAGASVKKPYQMANTRSDDPATILFTSGNTGRAKGVLLSHGNFDMQHKTFRATYGNEAEERAVETFPLFALWDPGLEMSSIFPDMDFARPGKADPKKVFQVIKELEATHVFISPILVNKLLRYGEKHAIKLPSIKRIITAGAPARPADLERFRKMLSPDAHIQIPYGATEAVPVINIESREVLEETSKLTDQGKGICIGYAVPYHSAEIIKITQEPIELWSDDLLLPKGEVGEIVVKGPNVTREYYNLPEETRMAKIPDRKNGGFYHRMGDVGYKDDKGRIWYCGRKYHRVVTSEGTLFTIPCEGVFNVHPDVFRTALVGVRRDGAVQPVLCVELEKRVHRREQGRIKEELLVLGASQSHTSRIKTIMFHPSFPVDIRHNAKIVREKMAEWANQQIS
jgi:acyl-coenzyme A synthetase/AMP-(fatty) acid ligase